MTDTAGPGPTGTTRNLDGKRPAKPERWQSVPTRVVTAQEAQAFLKVGRTTLWQLVRTGELRAFRAPGRRRLLFDLADLHAAVDAWRAGYSARRHPRVLRRLAR
jgi:excisionase family DNA binding protein